MKYLFLIFPLLFAFCTNTQQKAEESHTSPSDTVSQVITPSFEVDLVEIKRIPMYNPIVCRGFIEVPPAHRHVIALPVGGNLINIYPIEGSKVRKGQIIGVLSHPDIAQIMNEYLSAKAEADYLSAELKRIEPLKQNNSVSVAEYEKVKSEHQVKMAITRTRATTILALGALLPNNADDITSSVNIKSTVEGFVERIHYRIGEYVQPNQAIFSLYDPTHAHLELGVFETDIDKIKIGDPITFDVAGLTNVKGKAKVFLMSREVEETTRTINIHGHIIDEEKYSFTPGAFVGAQILTSADTVWALPQQSIIIVADGKGIVFQQNFDKKSFTPLNIEMGKSFNQYIEVITPVNRTAKYAFNSARDLFNTSNNDEGGHSH